MGGWVEHQEEAGSGVRTIMLKMSKNCTKMLTAYVLCNNHVSQQYF